MKSLFKKKKITGILEIGKSYLKIAVVEESYGQNRIITKLTAGKLDEKNLILNSYPLVLECDDLIIVLSRAQVTVRNLELPTTDPQEIKDIITIQAGKQTPFSKDEIISDFQTIGSNRPHYTKVLLAIVQKVIVNSYLNNLAEKKDAVQKIVLGSECLANWYPVIQPKIKNEAFAILDFDEGSCDFSVYSKDKLLFTRLLSLGISDLPEKGCPEDFLEEIRNILDTYKKENIGPAFNKVVLMGKTSNAELKDILANEFSLEAFGPFEDEDIEGISISFDAKAVLDKEKGVSFSKLIGLALNPEKPLMDFLPLALKQARLKRIRRKELMLTGILILSVFIVSGAIFLERVYAKALLLKRLNAQFIKLEGETSELKKEDLKIKLIKNRTDAGNSAIETLREIHKVTPQEIYLSAITFEEGKSLSLRGTSVSMSEAFKFVKTLEGLPNFRNVKTKYVTKRKLEGKDLADFEITCPLVSD